MYNQDYDLENITSKKDIEILCLETKRDIKKLENSLKKDIEILRLETKHDIAETKAELIRWVIAVGLLQTTIIVGLIFRLIGKI
jgi:sRNA-binding carbon storage regulator CsrA